MSDCPCRHDDPLDCMAALDGIPIEELLEDGENGCSCDCHEEPR